MKLNAKVCPYCGYEGSKVKDVRLNPTYDILVRRRICPNCNKAWNTAELPIAKTGYKPLRKVMERLDRT